MADLPETLVIDLSTRLPDPITLLDAEGRVIRTIQPDPSAFKRNLKPGDLVVNVNPNLKKQLQLDRVTVEVDPKETDDGQTWGAGAAL